jgi:uncharacterized membrane protein YhfC
MLSFGFILAILIEILLPVALGIWFARKFGASWKIFGVGVLTFIASQVVHFPMLYGLNLLMPGIAASLPMAAVAVINAVLLGLAAGICEETARWVGFKLLKARAKSMNAALMAGAGHGGVESIIIGLMVLTNFTIFTIVSSGRGNQFGLPMELQMSMAQQMFAYISMPWWMPLIGAMERVFAISLHLALSFMVWQAYKNRSWGWFIAAVLWHAFIDGAAVMMSTYKFNLWVIEGVIGVVAAANIVFLVWFVRRQLEVDAEDEEETEPMEGEVVKDASLAIEAVAPEIKVKKTRPAAKKKAATSSSTDQTERNLSLGSAEEASSLFDDDGEPEKK